jgi:hypothetical protein
MKVFLPTIILSTLLGAALAQIPQNNPYKSRYNIVGLHWTDSIRWNNVLSITDFGGNGNGIADNLQAINAGMQALSAAGGGVLYFPAGTYVVSDTLRLLSNVVLRGAEPSVANASDSLYRPPSKLAFPAYVPSFTGNGTPNSTAFKTIEFATGNERNVGLVNLDINRGGIALHPKFAISTTRPRISTGGSVNNADNWQPITQPRNIIIFGVRSNNVAIPDPAIPTPQQNQWQRFCWRFTANIDVTGIKNVLVANCRVNDSITDNYKQPGYICRGCPNGPNTQWGPAPDNVKTDFNYADHYGISVNRAKIRTVNGAVAIEPFHWYPIPTDEPLLFAKGVEVLDNWVYSTMRIKITAAGWGLKVNGNVGKDTTGKIFFLTPNGQARQTNNSATYECRGIDFSGFDVELIGNDVEVNNGKFLSNFPSICGEGIMNQGNSGGSRINGVTMRRNIVRSNATNNTNPAFTLYRLYNISNIYVDSNTAIGSNQLMLLDADQTSFPQTMYNAWIRGNNVNSLRVRGDFGGKNVFVQGNRGAGINLGGQAGSSVLRVPCYADTGNNLGYLLNEPCAGPFPGVVETPSVVFQGFSGKDSCIVAPQTFNITGLVEGNPDSVILFSDAGRVGPATINGSTFTYNWSIPNDYGYHYLTAGVYKNDALPITWAQTFKVNLNTVCPDGTTSIDKTELPIAELHLYPNPAQSTVTIKHNHTPRSMLIAVYTISGKSMFQQQTIVQQTTIDLKGWPKGMYIVKAIETTTGKVYLKKLMVE